MLTEEFCKCSFLVGPGVEIGVGVEAQCNVEEDTCWYFESNGVSEPFPTAGTFVPGFGCWMKQVLAKDRTSSICRPGLRGRILLVEGDLDFNMLRRAIETTHSSSSGALCTFVLPSRIKPEYVDLEFQNMRMNPLLSHSSNL